MKPHIIILTEGHSEPNTAKTAAGILRYRGGEVAALLDSTAPRATASRNCWLLRGPIVSSPIL